MAYVYVSRFYIYKPCSTDRIWQYMWNLNRWEKLVFIHRPLKFYQQAVKYIGRDLSIYTWFLWHHSKKVQYFTCTVFVPNTGT